MSKSHTDFTWHRINRLYIQMITTKIIIIMKSLDRLLEMLRDSQWHSLDEIENGTSLPENKLIEISSRLQEMEFIEKEKNMLRIKQRGLKFLELPV